MPSLVWFWIEFPKGAHGERYAFPWVGVTAFDMDDAMGIVRTRLLHGAAPPDPERVIEDVDLRSLDENHVGNQMSSPHVRGVWYPRGFEG